MAPRRQRVPLEGGRRVSSDRFSRAVLVEAREKDLELRGCMGSRCDGSKVSGRRCHYLSTDALGDG